MTPIKISLMKTISWRLIASFTTFLISWFITGSISLGASIMGIEMFAKMALYYFHERAWHKIHMSTQKQKDTP